MNPKLLLPFCLLAFTACQKKSGKIKPLTESITESVYASGVIKSQNQYQVYSGVNGILNRIHVEEGDSVRSGSLLFSISNDNARLNKENAELAADFADYGNNRDKIRELKIALDLAEKKMRQDSLLWMRQKTLWNQDIGSKLELEQRELAYLNARSAHESAALRLKELEKQLRFSSTQSKKSLAISRSMESDFNILSETNGKVYSILKKKGEMVSAQAPLAIIGAAGQFILELQVDEYDIARIKQGMQVFVSLDSYRDSVFEARISKIYPIMNERSKTFTVEAIFIRQPPALFPNLTVEANIVISSRQGVLTIPRAYLHKDSFVFLSDGSKKAVVTGLMDYQKVEIRSGISSADELILPVE